MNNPLKKERERGQIFGKAIFFKKKGLPRKKSLLKKKLQNK